MHAGVMLASVIGAWVLQASLVSSTSTGLGSHSVEGATSAVLSAGGGGHLLKAAAAATAGQDPANAECSEACDEYMGEVNADTDDVCIEVSGGHRKCSLTSCGQAGVEGLCRQRVEPECPSFCSEWGDVTPDSINVCMNNEKRTGSGVASCGTAPCRYKCTGEASCADVGNPEGAFRCRQKKIPDCGTECDGYFFLGNDTISQDTSLVCQNTDVAADPKMEVCLPLPCSYEAHNSATYKFAKVCKQVVKECPNICAGWKDGSTKATGKTVCFDDVNYGASPFFEHCTNQAPCTGDDIRCSPVDEWVDRSNIPNAGALLEKTQIQPLMRRDAVADSSI